MTVLIMTDVCFDGIFRSNFWSDDHNNVQQRQIASTSVKVLLLMFTGNAKYH